MQRTVCSWYDFSMDTLPFPLNRWNKPRNKINHNVHAFDDNKSFSSQPQLWILSGIRKQLPFMYKWDTHGCQPSPHPSKHTTWDSERNWIILSPKIVPKKFLTLKHNKVIITRGEKKKRKKFIWPCQSQPTPQLRDLLLLQSHIFFQQAPTLTIMPV